MYAKCRTYIDKWYSVGKGAYSAYTNLTPPPPSPSTSPHLLSFVKATIMRERYDPVESKRFRVEVLSGQKWMGAPQENSFSFYSGVDVDSSKLFPDTWGRPLC